MILALVFTVAIVLHILFSALVLRSPYIGFHPLGLLGLFFAIGLILSFFFLELTIITLLIQRFPSLLD